MDKEQIKGLEEIFDTVFVRDVFNELSKKGGMLFKCESKEIFENHCILSFTSSPADKELYKKEGIIYFGINVNLENVLEKIKSKSLTIRIQEEFIPFTSKKDIQEYLKFVVAKTIKDTIIFDFEMDLVNLIKHKITPENFIFIEKAKKAGSANNFTEITSIDVREAIISVEGDDIQIYGSTSALYGLNLMQHKNKNGIYGGENIFSGVTSDGTVAGFPVTVTNAMKNFQQIEKITQKTEEIDRDVFIVGDLFSSCVFATRISEPKINKINDGMGRDEIIINFEIQGFVSVQDVNNLAVIAVNPA